MFNCKECANFGRIDTHYACYECVAMQNKQITELKDKLHRRNMLATDLRKKIKELLATKTEYKGFESYANNILYCSECGEEIAFTDRNKQVLCSGCKRV
jgi:uncharacterized membrane protein